MTVWAGIIIMDETTRAKYEAKAQDVRASLKKWESDWADGHNGAKPGRQDIKNHPDIGAQGNNTSFSYDD